jgi:type I restriction enzyme S subunit
VNALQGDQAFITDSQWSTTVGAVCDRFGGEVQTGPFGSQLHAADYSENGIPVVMPQDMVEGLISARKIARVDERHIGQLARHQLKSGDIVFSRRGDVTRFAVVTPLEEGWLCGTGSIRIRLNSGDVDTVYLRHYLRQPSVGEWLLHQAKGVTMPNLNTEIIRALPLVYPPLQEQRRIAAILDKADALRQKRKRAIALLDSLTQSIFLEMFGDAAGDGSTTFRTVPFKDVTDRITYGFTQPMSHHDTGIPILTAKNVRFGSIDYDNVHFTSEADFSSLTDKSRPKRGDILITKDGTIGRCAILESDERLCINQSVCLVKLRKDSVEPKYVLHYLLSAAVQSRIDGMKKGNSIPHLQITELARFPISLPPKAQQLTFIDRVAGIQNIQQRAEIAVGASDALFASLQHRAFSGQL